LNIITCKRPTPITSVTSITLDAGNSLKKRDAKRLQEVTASTQASFDSLPEAKKGEPRMKFLLEDLHEIQKNHILRLTSKFDQAILDHFYKLFKALTKGNTLIFKKGECIYFRSSI
jgi:hypothetical protein